MATARPAEIVNSLLDPGVYPEKVDRVELVQTQISLVFLAGDYAYKLKKPVNLGFLDYTTPERRRYFCEREVELNRRLCPEVYLGVVPINYDGSGINLAGQGYTIDYAVKMVRLPHDRMMDELLERNLVTNEMAEQIARRMVEFHARAVTSPFISAFGDIEAIRINVEENFAQTIQYTGLTITGQQYQRIKEYTEAELRDKAGVFKQRVSGGRIRDGHGDLHSRNICFADRLCIYDCIEFNDRFRYGDVTADIAFLAMDLDHFGRADLSRDFVRAYIEDSRDTGIRDILRFYKCYRAYVRGKVSSFESADAATSESARMKATETARAYFELAESYTRSRPFLIITVGLTGTGKSTLANLLARRLGLTVISSDIMRKKLASIPLTEHRFEEMESGIYSASFSRMTYEKLFSEAREILSQGDPVILDASFIRGEDREKALRLAEEVQAEFAVVECILDEATVRQRLEQRLKEAAVSDGRPEVYELQKRNFQPVTEVPPARHYVIDTAQPLTEQVTRIVESMQTAYPASE